MQDLPAELKAAFERRLRHATNPLPSRLAYHRWIKFSLFFCQKFGYPPRHRRPWGPSLRNSPTRTTPSNTATTPQKRADYCGATNRKTIQRLLGHTDIKTTMISLQTVPTLTLKEAKSRLDCL